jgi:hypothetical protein
MHLLFNSMELKFVYFPLIINILHIKFSGILLILMIPFISKYNILHF